MTTTRTGNRQWRLSFSFGCANVASLELVTPVDPEFMLAMVVPFLNQRIRRRAHMVYLGSQHV